MFRSVLPHFSYVSLFLHLALVIQVRLWKGKGILAIVNPCHPCIGPGCSSSFACLESFWEAKVSL